MALCVGVMKCKKCKCRRRTWLLTTGTPPGAKATLMAGSAGEIRLCMDTSPAWWAERAILDDVASTCVCVSCAYDLRVLYICCSAPSCIQLHCHGVCALVLPED